MKWVRGSYKALRSVIFTAITLVASIYVLLYVALSLPVVQNVVRDAAEHELSKFLGSEVEIDKVSIHPFNEVRVEGLQVKDLQNRDCLRVENLGAGIDLGKLIFSGKIVITYAELLGMDARIVQPAKDAPLNIAFIIDAFKPKDKTKPPTKFDLQIRKVAIRKADISFDREWMPRLKDPIHIDYNHLAVNDLKADISLPRIKNDDFIVDIRRLALSEKSGFILEKLALEAHITNRNISLNNIAINLPSTSIRINDQTVDFDGYDNIVQALKTTPRRVAIDNATITPSDITTLLPANIPAEWRQLLSKPYNLTLLASGDLKDISVENLDLRAADKSIEAMIAGRVRMADKGGIPSVDLPRLKISVTPDFKLPTQAISFPAEKLLPLIIDSQVRLDASKLAFNGVIDSALGALDTDINLNSEGSPLFAFKAFGIRATLKTPGIDLSPLMPLIDKSGKLDISTLAFSAECDGTVSGVNLDGSASVSIDRGSVNGYDLSSLIADIRKSAKRIEGKMSIANPMLALSLNADALLNGELSEYNFDAVVENISRSISDVEITGNISGTIIGNSLANLHGNIVGSDIRVEIPGHSPLKINSVSLSSSLHENDGATYRNIDLLSDYVDAEIDGNFSLDKIVPAVKSMLASGLPGLMPDTHGWGEPSVGTAQSMTFDITVRNSDEFNEFLNLPVKLLTDIPIKGHLSTGDGTADIHIDIPYLQQGKDKLIQKTRLSAALDASERLANVDLSTLVPAKEGNVAINLAVKCLDNVIDSDLQWDFNRPKAYRGNISMNVDLSLSDNTTRGAILNFKPSTFAINDSIWNIGAGKILYAGNKLKAEGVRVWHDKQFVTISGELSDSPDDILTVNLSDIDLDYLFETLNINYVTFGGRATGRALASGLLGGEMSAHTEGLKVKNLTYNGALLGSDADLTGLWDNREKAVRIGADIYDGGLKRAVVDGGVWVTRDSLSFDLLANRVNIKFLQPFMMAFSKDVRGEASGHAKLYGTFSDIDLIGRIKADTIDMKVDYTNVRYAGSDSVYLTPGKISIPSFRIYDRYGHSALLNGTVSHRYFHEPRFEFRVSDASSLLCFDTNAALNPNWYGTIYGSGGGSIFGYPGYVEISVDMGIAPHSIFTFVLNDMQAAEQYDFLTFVDKHKVEEVVEVRDTVPDFVKKFTKEKKKEAEGPPSIFAMDIKATVTPQSEMVLVMDPIAGDKIRAFGSGALQLGYKSNSDELTMFGKYILERGNYNFSLQDIILKDFTIREGSSISFNGDPYRATLDIDALYRVNTSLTDLDKSFANDRELNRTSVPVDAVLQVRGDMQSPEITFDIELPTLTSDMNRKVKSIISTEDQMTRQMLYLLALGRFYTPEYMGVSANGAEWASMASTTLTSQLTNMLSQLTDKFTVAPSFRTDKGDFSDMEVDIALSSRLLNNRLLLNGNLGYRDRSTSNTTFVGDFDLEYLLNRNGNWRLKAYNHFNDQNYYLKSSLTTQGVGIIFRRDFNSWFRHLRKRKDNKDNTSNK